MTDGAMNGTQFSVSAVVVTHYSGSTIARCLDALSRQSTLSEVVLVDNGSADAAGESGTEDRRVRRIFNRANPGFAVACNQGARECSGDWLLFINPDCFLPDDALQTLLTLAAEDPSIGLLGAELVDAAGRVDPNSSRRDPRPDLLFSRQSLSQAAPHAPNQHSGSAGSEVRAESVEAVSGALMLMPRAVFERIGGFDTGYRLHFEDLDLCRRVREAGYRVVLAAGCRATHLKGVSSRRRPLWVEWHKHLGMLRYFRKFDRDEATWLVRLTLPIAVMLRFPMAAIRALWRARAARG